MAWVFAFLPGVNSSLSAAESALSALTALPAEERANLARIEGPEGNPRPDRWYFDVFAADSESGLREYVVADHQIVARRELSQFALELTAQDVLGSRFVRTDSSEVEKLARDYASANDQVIGFLDLTLAKPFCEARPVWIARCFDSSGVEFGRLVVAAENGTVFTHRGFPHEPSRLLPPGVTAASGRAIEQTRTHKNERQPQRLPVERVAQHSQDVIHSKRVPPTQGAGFVRSTPVRRPWWNFSAH